MIAVLLNGRLTSSLSAPHYIEARWRYRFSGPLERLKRRKQRYMSAKPLEKPPVAEEAQQQPDANEQVINAPLEQESISSKFKETTAWDIYNSEAKKVDNELVKDWTSSLNSLLVFAAIFSAILTAFIIESKKLLERDQTEAMVDILVHYVNSRANGTLRPYEEDDFSPPSSAVLVNCLLFGSLSASLVAALASVVALQWVAEFDAATSRGGSSPWDRANRRQFRFDGVRSWRMGGIIAALPQLMYFSVALFFAGMIAWMLFLHSIVAWFILGGAAIVGVFYFSSTLISVIFVSAPFKTTLTRSIYSGYHLLFKSIPKVIRSPRSETGIHWIKRLRQKYQDVYKHRENRVVKARINSIKYQSLTWLVWQIGPSDSSRRNLVSLLGEVLKWHDLPRQNREFWDEPWVSVLTFLAKKQKDSLHLQNQNADEEQEMAILLNCTALKHVKGIIETTKEYDYQTDPEGREYWSQHCITNTGSPSILVERSKRLAPHPLLLVTRDLPIPSLDSIIERQTALRLARWRNSEKKPFDIWHDIFASANMFSSDYFSSCVVLLCNYARSIKHHLAPAKKDVLLTYINQWSASAEVSDVALTALARVFEHLLGLKSVDPFDQSTPVIMHPAVYSRRIQYGGTKVQKTHYALTLALARDLIHCPQSRKQRRLDDLLAMIWLNPLPSDTRGLRGHKRVWNVPKDKLSECSLQDIQEEILQDWMLHVEDSPEMTEILCLLIKATSTAPNDVDLCWLSSRRKRSKVETFFKLRLFDSILFQDQSFVSPAAIVKCLCRALKAKEFTDSSQQFTAEDFNPPVSTLRSPYIRTLAHRALGVDLLADDIPKYPAFGYSSSKNETVAYMFWNMSPNDSETVWRLRALLISDQSGLRSGAVSGILEKAFTSTTELENLGRVFKYQTNCFYQPGPSHLLCHLQQAAGQPIIYKGNETLFGVISLHNTKVPPISALLMTSSTDMLTSLQWPKNFTTACMQELMRQIESFNKIQSSMLSFLLHLPVYQREAPRDSPAHVAILLYSIEKAIRLPIEEESFSFLTPLSQRVRFLTEAAKNDVRLTSPETPEQTVAEIRAVAENGQRIHERILAQQATLGIKGS